MAEEASISMSVNHPAVQAQVNRILENPAVSREAPINMLHSPEPARRSFWKRMEEDPVAGDGTPEACGPG